jgi:ATP-binding cassette, subfamily C, bacterial
MMVSQAERQRVALARAFLRRPSMLILDEATNSLDSENEGRVLDAIENRRGELTVVLIAQRLSTIRGLISFTSSKAGRWSSRAIGRRLARCATAASAPFGKRRV